MRPKNFSKLSHHYVAQLGDLKKENDMNIEGTHHRGAKMRAIVRRQFGGPEELVIHDIAF
jgi:hypothetical protein